jgi:hypothetical protein
MAENGNGDSNGTDRLGALEATVRAMRVVGILAIFVLALAILGVRLRQGEGSDETIEMGRNLSKAMADVAALRSEVDQMKRAP